MRILTSDDNWASVSEPHTQRDISLYVCYIMLYYYMRPSLYILLTLRSIFRSYTRRARILPRRGAERSAPPIVEATAHRGRAVPVLYIAV